MKYLREKHDKSWVLTSAKVLMKRLSGSSTAQRYKQPKQIVIAVFVVRGKTLRYVKIIRA